MKKLALFITFLVFAIQTQAQHTITKQVTKTYMSLKSYKLKYKDKPLTKTDSLNFRFHNNDTLVLVTNYELPKGVSVPYEYKDSTFLSLYKKVAFRTNGVDSTDKKQTMRYWKEPIKIYFSNSVSKKTKKSFMSFAETIANKVDSLSISEVKKVEESNYVIYYLGDYDYEPRLTNQNDYYLSWNKKQQIYKCGLRIDTKALFNESLIQYKLRELFIGTLGHFYLSNDFSCDSYLSNCYSKNKKLTPLDMEIIKYHYSYGICKGSNLEAFEKQHERAKKSLKNENSKMRIFHGF
ncbi:hypothetical protein [Corallibacter sp.]|uniref:hypothetical protein n=1 Tax=Corallibacter sp. TaxID=2038084 RepID=UPI003AB5321A